MLIARRLALAALPAVVLWSPIVLWTWARSGAPFGPFFYTWFPRSVYATVPMASSIATYWEPTDLLHGDVTLLDMLTRHSPLLLAGVLGALFGSSLAARWRLIAAAILACQLVLIVVFLTRDPRFLAGFPVGLVMVFASAPGARALEWARARSVRVASVALLVPWLMVAIYYARPFVAVATGLMSPDAFRKRYVGYFDDYAALDSLLPRDAVLRVDSRMSAVYAPRPPVWIALDAPVGAPLYQFDASCTSLEPAMTAAETVYFNPAAKAAPFRTPGRATVLAPLCVRRLRPAELPARAAR